MIQNSNHLHTTTTDDSKLWFNMVPDSKFKIQNYGSRYIRYHLLQSITLSNSFLSQLSLSLNAGFDHSLS
ncbi:hypothetical protein HanPI659440_Chr09g0320181 [Helianthus annuus]|nr:hypothetical protein HanPI659440_Chr09g0320181 [Helianthus annuus]